MSTSQNTQDYQLQSKIVQLLQTIYDPELPINIYDLGLIYTISIESGKVEIVYTLTSPNCPAIEIIPENISTTIEALPEVKSLELILTWFPVWDKSMMSPEARFELDM